MATWPPLLRPNSAVALPVSTLNSARASGFVRSGEKFEPPALDSFVSMPSRVKFQDRSRAPCTWVPPPVFAPETTPGCVSTRSSGLRPRPPRIGRLSTVRWSNVEPRLPEVPVWMTCAEARTSTVCSMAPSSSTALIVAGSPMRT